MPVPNVNNCKRQEQSSSKQQQQHWQQQASAAADPGLSQVAAPADRSTATVVGLLPEAAQQISKLLTGAGDCIADRRQI